MSNTQRAARGQNENPVRAEVANDQTRRQMVRTARRVLSAEESEDAAHDAVVQALVHAHDFRADAQVGTWLYRIAFNAALVRRRCAHRSDQRLLRVQREAGTGFVGATTSDGREVEENEQRQQLRAAVAQLPEAYRTVVERCVYEEQTPDAVAADLGITPSALRTRITRARDQLRALMSAADRSAPFQLRAA
jgi:RNA polymerase sigma-70 factor (ECF subfamily)